MTRFMLKAWIAASLFTTGCVFVPVGPPPMPVAGAAVSQIRVVVPQPYVGADALMVSSVVWHKARLVLSPVNGHGEVVHTLEAHNGGLRARAPIEGLPPGQYNVRTELIQELPSGVERVVAKSELSGDKAVTLNNGANALQVMVLPMVAGTQLALSPTERYVPRTSSSSRNDRWNSTVTVSDGPSWVEGGIGVLGAIIEAASVDESPSYHTKSRPSDDDEEEVAEEDDSDDSEDDSEDADYGDEDDGWDFAEF
jgi:hypothetical protein